jgi:hypothetical protein
MLIRTMCPVLALLAAGCPAPSLPRPATGATVAAKPAPRQEDRLTVLRPAFEVAVEQDGRPVPIASGQATIARRPFTLVIVTRDPKRGLLMNVSLSPDLYDAARRGDRLEDEFAPGTGMAEEQILRSRALMIAGRHAHHYLLVDPPEGTATTNRYHEVKRAGSVYRCARKVDSFEFVGEEAADHRKAKVSVAEVESDAIYLVFYLSDAEQRDQQRRIDFLRLILAKPSRPLGALRLPTPDFHAVFRS